MGAADQRIDNGVERRLQAAFAGALSAERCAVSMPYLNPIYRLPGSMELERARRHASEVGLGATIERMRRNWEQLQTRIEYVCPGDTPHERHDLLVQAVRRLNAALDPAIDQALARTPAAPRGTSAELVKALVEARWGAEHSSPTNCVRGTAGAAAVAERRRLQTLRASAARLGRESDLAAADQRWVAEKVKWERDTVLMDMMVGCKAEEWRAANDRIERLLAKFR